MCNNRTDGVHNNKLTSMPSDYKYLLHEKVAIIIKANLSYIKYLLLFIYLLIKKKK